MAKDRSESEKRDKKEKKKEKMSETNGISKDKSSDKAEKKKRKEEKKRLAAAIENDPTASALLVKGTEENRDTPISTVHEEGDTVVGAAETKPKIQRDEVKREYILAASVPFANPMADEKAMRKVLKSVKKAAKYKTLRRGVKEVVKTLRKSSTNPSTSAQFVVVLAADISPFDVISHIPVLCEDHHVPYIYVPSRAELGAAGSTKRPTSVIMVSPTVPVKRKAELEKAGKEEKEDWTEIYNDLVKVVEKAGKDVKI